MYAMMLNVGKAAGIRLLMLLLISPLGLKAQPDLQISPFSSPQNPSAFSFYSVSFSLSNVGNVTATDIEVSIPEPAKAVFQGGNEADFDRGTFIPFGNPRWIVPELAPNEQITIRINLFSLSDESTFAYAQVIAQSPQDADSTPGNGTPPTILEDDEALISINGGGGTLKPDLAISLRDAPSFVVPGDRVSFKWEAVNVGDAMSGSFVVRGYLSADRQLSSDDIFLSSDAVAELNPGERTTVFNSTGNVPIDLYPPGDYFIIIRADDGENIEESDESNNVFVQRIFVTGFESPAECTYSAGAGRLLCTERQANGEVDIFLLDQGNVDQVRLDRDGIEQSRQSLGPLVYDSLLVQGDQLVKKLANGVIAWQRSIPANIRAISPNIEAAVELNDGSIVLGGFQKIQILPGSPFDQDSLVLIKTDANLNLQRSSAVLRNSRNIADDQLHRLIAHPDGGFTAVYTLYLQNIIPRPQLTIRKFSADLRVGGAIIFSSDILDEFIQTPCDNYLINTRISFVAQKSNFSGTGQYTIDVNALEMINERRVGTGSVDLFGPYRNYSFVNFGAERLQSGYEFLRYTDPFPGLKNFIFQSNGAVDSVNTDFIPFAQIVPTSPSSVLIFRELEGQVLAYNPECNPPQDKPDLRLANLVASPLIAGTIPEYRFDLINDGNAVATGAYLIDVWLSTDADISSDDLNVGFVTTGNTPIGTIPNVLGTVDIPANTPAGNYFLILEADSNQEIDESNEDNNTIVITVVVEEDDDGGIPDCTASSDFPWEDWISKIKLGSQLEQSSGKSRYSDFTTISYTAEKGVALPLELTATFSYQTYDEYWRVWVDLDQDRVFESGELLYQGILNRQAPGNGVSYSLPAQLTIPATALNGPTKMRIIMSRGQYAPACGDIDFGEIEDYQLNITGSGPPPAALHRPLVERPDFRVFPNPAADYAILDMEKFAGQALAINVYDQFGRLHWQRDYEAAPPREYLELNSWLNGTYTVWLKPLRGKARVHRLVLLNTY
ncbi:MAG: CARDB domain-containing protein [Bacteroidota bacterium]